MKFDSRVANTSGFFKDPVTFEDLTGLEERVVKCSIDDSGKFIWPQIKFSDGSVGKIVYKLFTTEEKDIYKQYRGRGVCKHEVSKVDTDNSASTSTYKDGQEIYSGALSHSQVCYDGACASKKTLDYIKQCDTWLGVSLEDGVIHDLLAVKGSNSYEPVPRCLIPKEDRIRLGIGV